MLPGTLKTARNIKVIVSLFALFSSACGVAYAEELNLTYIDKSVEQSIAADLLADIYKRAGIAVKLQPMIGARATLAVLAGKTDGEVARVDGYAQNYPELIKVTPPYYYVTTAVFAKSGRNISISNKMDLRKFKVGAIRNVAHVENNIRDVENVRLVDNSAQLYQILENGVVDVVVDSRINGMVFAKKLGYADIHEVGELAKGNFFNLLHGSKKDIASKIGSTIKSLTESGELARITKRAEENALDKGKAN